jgi:uncharacterized membrane protein YccF (DUF307 family)
MSRGAAGQIVTGIRFLLNIIWLVLCGLWLAILYVIAGVIMCVLIITIPFGLQAFKLAGFILWPFGRTVVRRSDAGAGSVIGNILWLVLVGWWLAIGHIVTAIALAITIIGIPLAIANLKLVPISLLPFGRVVVPIAEAEATGAGFV